MNLEELKQVGTSSIYETNDNVFEIASYISTLDDNYLENVNCEI